MRIVQFIMKTDPHKIPRVGVFKDNTIVDFKTIDDTAPDTLLGILKHRPGLLHTDTSQVFTEYDQDTITMDDVKLLAPITGCDKVICVGMNYKDHCEEQNVPVPEEPIFFNKFPSCLHGPNSRIHYPEATSELDYEVELAVVLKKKAKNITKDEAFNYVLGYTVAHDVSARDWQLKKNGGQWLIGKAMDEFCPIGPCVVTQSEIEDPHNLDIRCVVNGETKQHSNTSNLVFKIPDLIAKLSQLITLLPGDVILTGTPPGVGVFANPPCFLKPGDIVECEIDGIGSICNKIVECRNCRGEMYCDL